MMATWRDCADFSSYHRWNDISADKYLAQEFEPRVVAAYRQCAVPAMKADLFRYCVLYKSGGLYADADIGHQNGLMKILQTAQRAMLFQRRSKVANDLLYFREPLDPLLKVVFEQAVSNIEQKSSNNVWQITGPGIMTLLFKNQPDLFEGITWAPLDALKGSVRFNWKMSYKDGADHWTSFQTDKSIFVD